MTNRRTICLRIVLWLLVVLWMGLIFSFSAQNADSSREVSGRVIRWLLAILDRQFSELPPEEQLLRMSGWSTIVRKLAHFGLFAVLGILSFAA